MVKQLIKEAMDKNPIGLKEALAEELKTRIALALEAKMDHSDMDDEDEMDDDDLEEGKNILKKRGNMSLVTDDDDESLVVKKGSKEIAKGFFDRNADGWFFTVKGSKGQKLFREPDDVLNFFMKEEYDLEEAQDTWRVTISGMGGATVQGANRNQAVDRALSKMKVRKTERSAYISGVRKKDVKAEKV
jgi:hypothetical protein